MKICRHCHNTIVMPTHHQNVVSLITAMIKASSFSFGHCTNRNQWAVSSPILSHSACCSNWHYWQMT